MTQHAPTVGIIGLGFGRAPIPAFQVNGCRVVALCQRDQPSAKAVADRYGVEHVFGRWEEMLETATPEIAVIATPPHLHRAIAIRAFGAGAHVLCEKPIAMTRTDAEAMVDAARRAGRVAMTCFNWRFSAAMQELHARVTEGSLGRVIHLALRWMTRPRDPPDRKSTRLNSSHQITSYAVFCLKKANESKKGFKL